MVLIICSKVHIWLWSRLKMTYLGNTSNHKVDLPIPQRPVNWSAYVQQCKWDVEERRILTKLTILDKRSLCTFTYQNYESAPGFEFQTRWSRYSGKPFRSIELLSGRLYNWLSGHVSRYRSVCHLTEIGETLDAGAWRWRLGISSPWWLERLFDRKSTRLYHKFA